jgi:polysaccharide chain length determinant protein (PEP-CTERM system associated)
MGAVPNQVSAARRQPDIEDYIDMVRRYRSWIIGPMFAGLVIATVVAFMWPDTYVSRASMRIKAQVVPDKLVPAVLNTQMSERLEGLKAVILSRQSLQEIVLKPSLDLYKKERAKMPVEDVVDLIMRKNIIISSLLTSSDKRKVVSIFTISFSYPERYKARLVVQDLVNKFQDQNLNLQREQVTLTTSFLDDTLKQAKDKMDRLDAEITKFKIAHPGQLPEQTQSGIAAMNTIQVQIMQQTNAMNNLQYEKAALETQLKSLKNRIVEEEGRAVTTETVAGQPPASVRNDNLTNLDKELARIRGDYEGKSQRLGKKHPDVIQLTATLASLEQQRANALASFVPPPSTGTQPVVRTVTNPVALKAIQELRNDIELATQNITTKELRIQDLQKNIDGFHKQLASYQKRLEDMPASEQQYAALTRDYELAKAAYETSMQRRGVADTAKSIEDHQAGEQLEQLDPPNLPDKPSEPNRAVWAMMGVFGGLMLGLSLAVVKEVKDTSLKNLKDVRAYTNLPVLSSIPLLENALLIRRKRRLILLAWASAVLIGGVMMGGAVYYYVSAGGVA